jgi:hypothetical protein
MIRTAVTAGALVVNAVVFALYVRRQGYAVGWALAVGLLTGPFAWPGWLLVRYGERRGRDREG